MPTIQSLMPDDKPDDERIRINGRVSLSDKRIVLSACADDGIFNLIVAHAFRQTAEFIRHYDIVSYDPAKFTLLSNFICHRTDPRTVGSAPVVNDTGATSSVQPPNAPAQSVPRTGRKGNPRGTNFKAGQVKGSGD